MQRKIRVLVGKPGLDGHDRGAKVVAAALRDAGMEVVYTGLHQSPAQIVEAAVQEDVDVVALSVLSGAHMTLFPEVQSLMSEAGIGDKLLTGGGIIPPDDMHTLTERGVGRLFGPGASTVDIVEYIREWYGGRYGADALPPLPPPPARVEPMVHPAEHAHHAPRPSRAAPRKAAKQQAAKQTGGEDRRWRRRRWRRSKRPGSRSRSRRPSRGAPLPAPPLASAPAARAVPLPGAVRSRPASAAAGAERAPRADPGAAGPRARARAGPALPGRALVPGLAHAPLHDGAAVPRGARARRARARARSPRPGLWLGLRHLLGARHGLPRYGDRPGTRPTAAGPGASCRRGQRSG